MNKDFNFEDSAKSYFERLMAGSYIQQFRCSKEHPCPLAGCNSSDSSPDLSPIRKRSISPEGRKGGKNSMLTLHTFF